MYKKVEVFIAKCADIDGVDSVMKDTPVLYFFMEVKPSKGKRQLYRMYCTGDELFNLYMPTYIEEMLSGQIRGNNNNAIKRSPFSKKDVRYLAEFNKIYSIQNSVEEITKDILDFVNNEEN